LSRVAIRGVSLAGAGYALSQLLTFATYFVLAKLISPAEFGHFTAGTLVAGVGAVIGESGMVAALIHRRDRIQEAFNSAFLATLAGGFGLTLLALASAPLIGLLFRSDDVRSVAAVMSGLLLFRMAVIVPNALLQRRFSFVRRVVVDPLAVIAFGAASIVAAAEGLGVWALVIGTYASAVVNVATAWALAGWRPQLRLASVRTWRELARYGRPVVGAELIRRLASEIPVVAIGRFVGAGALGQFGYAMRVATQPLGAVINAGGYVLLPIFSRLSAHDDRFRAAFLRALRWLCALAFPAALVFIPLGEPAVVVVFGEQWRQAGVAVMVLSGFCAALTLDSIATEAWKASGRPDMLARMHTISLVLTLVFVAAGAPFGLLGVVSGLSLSALGVAAYALFGVGQILEIPVRRLLHEVWPPTLASGVMAGAIFALEHGFVHADRHGSAVALLLLLGEALLAAVLYVGALAVVAPATTSELLRASASLIARSSRRRPAAPASESI
jgi:PST family polysaccharide transporter